MPGMPIKARPQADKSAGKRKVPATGPDFDGSKKVANASATSPRTPDRDGPAKDAAGGKMAGKPKTSEKTMASMKASLKRMQ